MSHDSWGCAIVQLTHSCVDANAGDYHYANCKDSHRPINNCHFLVYHKENHTSFTLSLLYCIKEIFHLVNHFFHFFKFFHQANFFAKRNFYKCKMWLTRWKIHGPKNGNNWPFKIRSFCQKKYRLSISHKCITHLLIP